MIIIITVQTVIQILVQIYYCIMKFVLCKVLYTWYMITKRPFFTQHHYHYKHHYNSNKHHSNNTTTNNTTTIIKPPKKKKDPNAPKGPGNVFFLYCRFQRDKIKDENPEENIGDVTKILGLKWKALPKEEKQFYYDTFKREMDEYEEAMKIYKANGGKVCEEEESTTAAVVVAEESSLASSPANTSTITSPDNEHHLQPTIINMLAVDNTMVEEEEEEDF